MLATNYFKYSATGNYLLIVDDRLSKAMTLGEEFWKEKCKELVCDGVVFLQQSTSADIKMVYINADGIEVTMCGNGLRSLGYMAFHELKIIKNKFSIETKKGLYTGEIKDKDFVRIKMTELYDIGKIDLTSFYDFETSLYLNTGVPHAVFFCDDVNTIDVNGRGAQMAHNNRFKGGCNINFVQVLKDGEVNVRTFERGVEKETLSCGTGAVAVAIAAVKLFSWKEKVIIHYRGGDLLVELDEKFDSIYLSGKVEKLLEGHISFDENFKNLSV